jgi:outer membrane protein OmpA-like peptidoglycan-associated protein
LDLGVTGHASEDGTPEYNSWLSGRRAKAAFEDLKSRGVPEQQLRYRAVGESACRPYPIHRSVYFEIEEYR